MKKSTQFIIICTVFFLGITIFILLTKHKARPKKALIKKIVPIVKVIVAKSQNYQMIIKANGEVKPISIANIVPEVKGRITYVSPNLRQGNMVKKGELLVQIDKRDYEFAMSRALAELKQANSTLIQVREEAKQAKEEWYLTHKEMNIPPLAAKLPQLEAAMASFLAAKAGVLQAKLNLERTSIHAPYSGIVLKRNVDIGNTVSYGQILSQIYPTKEVEVHIPLSMSDLEWIDVPGYTVQPSSEGSNVTIEYSIGKQKIQFQGKIQRSIGEIDKNTRMLYVVAIVKNPFKKIPPLLINTFVEAKIKGRLLKHIFLLPMDALFEGKFVLKVIDNHIKKTKVNIAKIFSNSFIVLDGVSDNDKLIISPMSGDVDGMEVKIVSKGIK